MVPTPDPEHRKPLMQALAPVAGSSNPRRSKSFAIRSFPTLCGPATTSEAPPEIAVNFISDQKAPPSSLITPSPEPPTSCGPGNSFLSYRGKIFKPPIAFAKRQFPKGCGPLAASISKPSDEASIDIARRIPEDGNGEKDVEKSNRNSSQIPDCVEGGGRVCRPEAYEAMIKVEEMEEKLNDVVRRIPEEGSGLGNISENALVGESFGGRDGEKPNRNSSVTPDFVKDGKSLCRPEGSETKNKIEEIEEKLTDILRRTSKEGSRLGKVFKNTAVGKSLGGKNGVKPDRKSSLTPDFVKGGGRFGRPERSETRNKDENMKEKLNNDARRIANERNGLGKVLESDEKDDKKPNRKRALAPDLAENGRSEEGQLLEVRGDRLIVLALMAAKKCPWMQGKGKSSIVLQSLPKKPRIRASGNSDIIFFFILAF